MQEGSRASQKGQGVKRARLWPNVIPVEVKFFTGDIRRDKEVIMEQVFLEEKSRNC